MRLSYERREKLTELMSTIAGALILIALVMLTVWACSASSPGTDTGCSRAYCIEDQGGGDGPDHPDLGDVYDYDPLDDQMREQQLDEADRQQELEDARQEGYEEGHEDGGNDGP